MIKRVMFILMLTTMAAITLGQDSSGVFRGTVTDSSDGTPIPGALLVLRLAGGGPGGGTILDSVVTGVEGSFEFADLATGGALRYSIAVNAAGFIAKTASSLLLDSGGVDTVDFELNALDTANSWIIHGKVTADSANGTALVGAQVTASTRSGQEVYYGVTVTGGLFSLLIPEGATNYQVTVVCSGYVTKQQQAEITDDSTEVNIFLVKTTSAVEMSVTHSRALWLAIPNPWVAPYALRFNLPASGAASLGVYDLRGCLLERTDLNGRSAGTHRVALRGGYAAGSYLVVLKSAYGTASQKAILVR